MSNEKRSESWISLFPFVGILLLIASICVVIAIQMEITIFNTVLALVPSITFWSWFCLDLWRHNGHPRYVLRWIDPKTGEEQCRAGRTLDEVKYPPNYHAEGYKAPIFIRQKESGWGGSSALIIPDDCGFPNAAGWSLDQSSTLSEIVLVDTYGVVIRTSSLKTAIWTITHDWSVISLLERSRQDALRLEQFGNQRDELIGAFLCLERLVDQNRDTFGNSPYGALVRHYTNTVLRNLLEQDVDLTRSVFIDQMNNWQHLADQCITRFGRR